MPASSSGLLTGHDGVGPFQIKTGIFQVPVNTPVGMKIDFTAYTELRNGPQTSAERQTLRFDSALGGLFDLPSGVTVNSAQAGIVNNGWAPPTSLYLAGTPESINVGESLHMTAFNGESTYPVGLFLTRVNGAPMTTFLGIWGLFDTEGHYTAPGILALAGWSGQDFGLTAIALTAASGIKISGEVIISVQ